MLNASLVYHILSNRYSLFVRTCYENPLKYSIRWLPAIADVSVCFSVRRIAFQTKLYIFDCSTTVYGVFALLHACELDVPSIFVRFGFWNANKCIHCIEIRNCMTYWNRISYSTSRWKSGAVLLRSKNYVDCCVPRSNWPHIQMFKLAPHKFKRRISGSQSNNAMRTTFHSFFCFEHSFRCWHAVSCLIYVQCPMQCRSGAALYPKKKLITHTLHPNSLFLS